MAKTARKVEEILGVKERILRAALDIIVNNGFTNLSMRKLAAQLGMTAANIYNYYNNKDEIYLLIRARGFEKLYLIISKTFRNNSDPLQRLEAIIRIYIDFGIKNPDYYEIMFSHNMSRYIDYAGTEMERAAQEERQIAIKVIEVAFSAMKDTAPNLKEDDVMYHVIKIWILLNGIVNLCNTIGVRKVKPEIEIVIERIVEDIVSSCKQ
jgi:AcrR family transcriptional regulator